MFSPEASSSIVAFPTRLHQGGSEHRSQHWQQAWEQKWEWPTWQGSTEAMAWHAFKASWQTSSSPAMMRWVTMRVHEEGSCWLQDKAELTANSQSAAAAGSRATLRRMDRATLSSLYQGLRGRVRPGPGWGGQGKLKRPLPQVLLPLVSATVS